MTWSYHSCSILLYSLEPWCLSIISIRGIVDCIEQFLCYHLLEIILSVLRPELEIVLFDYLRLGFEHIFLEI